MTDQRLGYEPPPYRPPPRYAGVMRRAAATLMDLVFLGVGYVLVAPWALRGMITLLAAIPEVQRAAYRYSTLLLVLAWFPLAWLYHATLERSPAQATPGKRALGLRIADARGRPISFGRAGGRFFAKLVSAAILLIGFAFAAFSPRRQALHDMIAATVVERLD